MRVQKSFLFFVLSFFAAGLFLVSCAKKKAETQPKKDKAFVSFVLGNVTLVRGNESKRQIKTGEPVLNGDSIETSDKGHMTLQIRNDIVILLSPNTKITLNSLENAENKDFHLQQGEALSKLGKLTAGQNYKIKTPSMVVGVRGTEFLARHDKGLSSVAVGTGLVQVVKIKTNEEIMVGKGKAADVTEKVKNRAPNQVENLKLKLLNKIPVIKDYETLPKEKLDAIETEIKKSIAETLQKIESLNQERFLNLDELKAKHGRIDVVSLYSGKIINGIITERGELVKILTPDGVVTVSAKDIQATDVKK